MTLPEWRSEANLETFQGALQRRTALLERELRKNFASASLEALDDILIQLSNVDQFILRQSQTITAVVAGKRHRLPAARDANGVIPKFFVLKVGEWHGYLYIDGRTKIIVACAARHDSDPPIQSLRHTLLTIISPYLK